MKGPASLRGPYVVARHEFLVNLRSVRLLIMFVVLGLVVVGGAYGLGAGSGGEGPQLTPVVVWGHLASAATGENVAVAWVADPFGNPLADRSVFFLARQGDADVQLGEVRTDGDGFARLSIGTRTEFDALVRLGLAEFRYGFSFFDPGANFTTSLRVEDLDNDGLLDDVGIHVLTLAGVPAAAGIYLNGTFVTSVDDRGYGRVELPPGHSNITVEVAGERETVPAYVDPEVQVPFTAGPDYVLLVIASVFATFVVPIFAIVLTFDAISKERVQGTLDLLLSRPIGRAGTLLGKLAGTFGAVAVPVTLTNLAGIGVLAAVSGQAPTGTFAAAFLGLGLLLIAFYVLLQLVLSTLAKTSGTAILFGILAWLAFNLLYPVITLVLSSVLFPNNFEGQFRFSQVAGLGNPSSIYQQLVAFAAPEQFRFAFPGTTLDLSVVASAAAVWFAILLALALFTFQRKAAE